MKGKVIKNQNGEFILYHDYVTETGKHLYQELPIHPYYRNATFDNDELKFQYAKECEFHFPKSCQCKDLKLYAMPYNEKQKNFDYRVFIITVIAFLLLMINAFSQGVSIQSGIGASHLDVPYLKECGVKTLRIQIKPSDRVKKYGLTSQTAFNSELGWALRIVEECNRLDIKPVISFNDLTLNDTITDEMPIFWNDSTYLKNAYFYIDKIGAKFANKVYAFDFLAEPALKYQDTVIAPPRLEEFYTKALAIIRKHDKKAYFMLSPGPYGLPTNYSKFLPFNLMDSLLIYNFHMYLPFNYTHQGLKGRPKGVEYPLSNFNADTILKRFKTVKTWSDNHGYKIFMGEFNAVRWSKNSGAYIQDVINAAEFYGFEWCYFAYKPNYKFWNPFYGIRNTSLPPAKYTLKNYGIDSQQWLLVIYNLQNDN